MQPAVGQGTLDDAYDRSHRMIRSSAIALMAMVLVGCEREQAWVQPLGSYRTPDGVVLDGVIDKAEWKWAERSEHIEIRVGKHEYYRHYVWSMFDDEWLYLAIRTSFQPSFGTQRVFFPGDSERDGFRLCMESEEQQVLRVEVIRDGYVCGVRDLPSWRRDRPTKQQITDDIRRSCGLDVKCGGDGDSGVSKGVWTCEYAHGKSPAFSV